MVIRLFLLLIFLVSCLLSRAQDLMYKVNKIRKVGNYYVIYTIKGDSTFKIVSKKQNAVDCNRIMKNKSYSLSLVRIQSSGGPEVDCITFDKRAVICEEPGMPLMIANNLKGLCLMEK